MSLEDVNGGVSAGEAAAALKAVERAGRRSEALGFSAAAGPQLVVWGLVWLACNSFVQFGPPWAPAIWLPGVLIGTGFSIYVSRRCGAAWDGRRGASFMVLVVFVYALVLGLGLKDPQQGNFLISLIVACAYMMVGIWRSAPVGWTGVAVAVLTIAGWWGVHPWFAVWMGVVGGGTLILTGLWMRRL